MNPTRDFSEPLPTFIVSRWLETILRILEWPITNGRFAIRTRRTKIAQRRGIGLLWALRNARED